MSITDRQYTRVVVIGGGYAGSVAANRLRLNKNIDITVVNPRPEFVERTRLHQVATGSHHATGDYGKMLGKGISLVVDTAERIDTSARTVKLASGISLDYDYVIYAVGSTSMVSSAVPGAVEFAHNVGEFEHAQRLRRELAGLPPGAPVTVIGGGFTGIEAAGEVAEHGHTVRLVSGGVLAEGFSDKARNSVAAQLSALGVSVLEGTRVAEVRSDAVVLQDSTVLPSPVTIWAGGFGVPALARDSGLSTDTLGRLLTDETLTSIDDDRVIAAGDASSPSGRPLQMGCQSALPLGAMAAQTVLSRIAGERPASIDLRMNGIAVSVGRRAATLQLLELDESPKDRVIAGRMAAPIKQLGLKSAKFGVRVEALRPGSVTWLKGGREFAMVPEPA